MYLFMLDYLKKSVNPANPSKITVFAVIDHS